MSNTLGNLGETVIKTAIQVAVGTVVVNTINKFFAKIEKAIKKS